MNKYNYCTNLLSFHVKMIIPNLSMVESYLLLLEKLSILTLILDIILPRIGNWTDRRSLPCRIPNRRIFPTYYPVALRRNGYTMRNKR